MIDRQAMVDEFCELVRIDSLSGQEKRVSEVLAGKLREMGLSVEFDKAHEMIGGNVGNLIAKLPASDPSRPTLMLQSHTDTVTPGEGIVPVVGDTHVTSAGETVLGADAKAGVTVILHTVRDIVASGAPHGELQVVLCIAEETGLYGAKYLDYSKVSPAFCYVLDGGKPAGRMTTAAPSAYKMDYTIKGLAAHAGVRPEAGISAIEAAAAGISRMKLGRLDYETTANIGIISGGQARNIVADTCVLQAEARSHDEAKLQAQLAHMRMCLDHAAQEAGATLVEPELQASYKRFHIPDGSPIVQIAWRAALNLGLEPATEAGGGGSDANVFNDRGIPSVICSTGAEGAHTLTERLDIAEMVRSAEWLVEIVKSAR